MNNEQESSIEIVVDRYLFGYRVIDTRKSEIESLNKYK